MQIFQAERPTSPSFQSAAIRASEAWRIAFLFVFAAAGTWVSYHYCRWQWHLEGDIAAPYLMWRQVLRDGLGVLTEWRYAQDNWLLSLTLPDFALLSAIGGSALAVMCQGWVFFLLNALLTYFLLSRVASWLVSAVTATALLFAGPAVLGGAIYLTYPITHNISLVWGLGGLACLVQWLRGGRRLWFVLGGVALFVGDVSDPWLGPALVLPIVLGAGIAAALRDGRGRLLGIGCCAAIAFALARTRLLGLLWFLPGSDFTLGGLADWWQHLGWIATYTAVMFNVVPVAQPEFEWLPPVWLVVVNCVFAVVMAGWSIWRVCRHWRTLGTESRFLATTAVVGCATIAAAFTVSNVHANLNVGRYISNWFYFVPLLVVTAAFGATGSSLLRRAAAGWCLLLVLAGIAAIPWQQTVLPADIAPDETRALIRFLEDNNLTYGYAPFWATNGSALQWLTHGRIVIRPVSLSSSGRIAPRIPQTFPSWFESSDVPNRQRNFFFLAIPDAELCPDVAACEALARHDFGLPQRVLHFGNFPVPVWNYPIMTGLPNADLIGAAPVLLPGQPVWFTRAGTGGALQWRGWSGLEENASWTEARQAVLMIHLSDHWLGSAVLEFEASAFPARNKRAPQRVTVSVDGKVLATWTVTPVVRRAYNVTVPAEIAERKRFALVLDIPDAARPSDLRYVYDVRLLGLYLASLTLRP